MKFTSFWLTGLILAAAPFPVLADTPGAASPPVSPESYSSAMARLYSLPALQDYIMRADSLVDGVDSPSGGGGVMHAETKDGLAMDATLQKTKEAHLYYFSISRGGAEFHYSDAVKFIALYADRFGLPHPCNVTSGEHDIYYAQWLFKPSDAKKMKKFMTEVRAQSRREKNPTNALGAALRRELDARAAAQPVN